MNRRRAAWLLGLLVCARVSLVSAHDFWLQPKQYWIPSDALTSLTLQVGHGPLRQRSPIPAGRITHFQALTPDGALLDLRKQLRLGEATEDGEFHFTKPGTYLLVLRTDYRAQTHLPSLRFNDYLKAEGLTPALEQRARLHLTDADGSERYSRCAKAIVQVGASASGPRKLISKPLGLPLEIVPEVSPYDVPRSATLPVRVIYAGHPLAGALVKLTNLEHDATPFEARKTDDQGRASFTMPSSGSWLLNVVWTKPLPRSEETDFETVFSSLSFGFASERP